MTSSDPDVIRRQIEDTRRELSYDVDALNEKVNPARVVDRRVTRGQGPHHRPEGEGDGQRPRHHLVGPRHGVERGRLGAGRRVQRRRHRAGRRLDRGRRRPAGAGHDRPPDPGQPPGRRADRLRRRLARLQPAAGVGEGEAARPAGRDRRPRAQGRAARAGQAGRAGDRRAAQAGRPGRRRVGQVDRSGRRRDRQGRGPVRGRRTCRARPSSPRRRCRASPAPDSRGARPTPLDRAPPGSPGGAPCCPAAHLEG